MQRFLLPRRSAHILEDEWDKIREWSQSDPEKDVALIREWEDAIARHVGVAHAAAVNSGRAGMAQILQHLELAAGDEVVVPAYTLKDLVPLIQDFGATVIPADIHPETLNMTANAIAAKLSSRTKAVIVLHAFGSPAPMPEILAVTEQAGVPVIEDCAHALGATLGGKQVGSFGYAAFFSFEMTKPINTYGGGMVVSQDASLMEAIRTREEQKPFNLEGMLQKVKATQRELLLMGAGLAWPLLLFMTNPKTKALISAAYRRSQCVPAATVRYSPLQARIGLEKLTSLDARIQHRQQLAAIYEERLPEQVRLQRPIATASPTWYFCAALLPEPAVSIRSRMLLRRVDAAVEEEVADDCGALLGSNDCPNAKAVFAKAMALPMFDSCREEDIKRAIQTLTQTLSTSP